MSLAFIRKTYNLPLARRGQRVEMVIGFDPHLPRPKGTITGSRGCYLRVRSDGGNTYLIEPFRVRYLEE